MCFSEAGWHDLNSNEMAGACKAQLDFSLPLPPLAVVLPAASPASQPQHRIPIPTAPALAPAAEQMPRV